MAFKYFWKLDIKGLLRAKLQISNAFGSNFNLGEGDSF